MSKRAMLENEISATDEHRRDRGWRPVWLELLVLVAATLSAAGATIVSGDGHYLALSDNGVLYGWGRNDFGQLGSGGKPPTAWGGPTSPAIVPAPPGCTWKAVAAGDNHSLAISSDGSLWGWGRNDMTQLSFRTSLTRRWLGGGHRESSPVRISSETGWKAVAGGMLSSFALKRDGSLWAWGGNWMGQLGEGRAQKFVELSFPLENLPQKSGLNRIGRDNDWIRISTGSQHVLGQKRDGTLWAWGRNDCGQLGIGTLDPTNAPVRISPETQWIDFSAAGAGERGGWSAAIRRDGSLWVWGNWQRIKVPKSGFTSGDTNIATSPLHFGIDTNWLRIACGTEMSAAIKNDGALWVWGTSAGSGVTLPEASATPRQYGSDRDWREVSTDHLGWGGDGTIHALKADGTVWTWSPLFLPAKGIAPGQGPTSTGVAHEILRLNPASK